MENATLKTARRALVYATVGRNAAWSGTKPTLGLTIEATVKSQLQTPVLGNFAMTPQASHAGAALAASKTSDGKLSLGTAENIGAAAGAKADGRNCNPAAFKLQLSAYRAEHGLTPETRVKP